MKITKLVTFNGKTIGGPSGIFTYKKETLPPFTMRVKCVGKTPIVKSGATVTAVAGETDIYDITYNNPDWSSILIAGKGNGTRNSNATALTEIIDANMDGVTKLDGAFAFCEKLAKVARFNTNTVTSLNSTFYYCKSLIEIPAFDTANVIDFRETFLMCTSLIKVHKLDTSNGTDFSNTFAYCTSLTTLPSLDLSSATNLQYMFNGCSNFVVSPKLLNTGNVSNIYQIFGFCYKLKTIQLFDTHNVTMANKAFFSCESLTNIPQFNFQSVSHMSETFIGCSNITRIPSLNTTSELRIMDRCFENCTSLVEIDENFYMKDVTDCARCFMNCISLTHINVSKLFANVQDAERMFDGCKKLDNAVEIYSYFYDIGVNEHGNTFTNAGIDTEDGLAQLTYIPTSWGGLGNENIWIEFKFSDSSYNPNEHQLGVGQAVTGIDKYNQASKNFSAIWVKKPLTTDTWRWTVQSGTNLSNAFVYGDGTGTGVPMLSNATIISGIPADLTLVEGGTIESLRNQAQEWLTGHEIASEDYVPNCQIISWDLDDATDITAIIGTNIWYNNCLYGTLPKLKSDNIANISYAFERCWNITSMGDIELPDCDSGSYNAFFSMLNLTRLPKILDFGNGGVSNTFRGCINASKESIELSYTSFNLYDVANHANCYTLCGINQDATALDQIPTDWGGNMSDSSVWVIGTSLWRKETVSYVNNDMIDLTDSLDTSSPEPSDTDMQYFNYNGTIYYNKKAIEYINNNIQTLYPGWHIPTPAEAQEVEDALLINDAGYEYLEETIMSDHYIRYYKDWDDRYIYGYLDAYSYNPVIKDNTIWYSEYETCCSLVYYPTYGIMPIEDYYPIYLVKDKQ